LGFPCNYSHNEVRSSLSYDGVKWVCSLFDDKLSYEEWVCSSYGESVRIGFAESGRDREADFCLESELERAYERYVERGSNK